MPLRKRIILPCILLAAAALWISRHQQINATERAIEKMRSEAVTLTKDLEATRLEVSTLEQELQEQTAARQELTRAVAKVEKELSRVSPESQWSSLPSQLPEWNAESPYVWVRKEVMKEVSAEPFGDDGALLPQTAPLLALDSEELGELNEKLTRILGQYQQIESTNVVLSDEHLGGVGPIGKGKAITVCWEPSDEGPRLMAAYEEALRSALGDQRTELLLAVDWGALPSKFGMKSDKTSSKKKITLVRHPNGNFNVAVDQGYSSMSTSVSKGDGDRLENYIPQHVRHLFAELLEAP